MFQPCHGCLAPLSRQLLPRDMPKAGHRAEPHSFVGLYYFSWGMDAVDEEEKSVLVKEIVSGGSGIHWDLELELCILMNWCLKKTSNVIKFCPAVWNGN